MDILQDILKFMAQTSNRRDDQLVIISLRESLTLGLVGATLQARKASLYESSRTPRAFSPLTPSES